MRRNGPAESGEERDYLSYLVRLWRVADGEKTVWRGSLECALSGKTYNFASLDRLLGFLWEQTGHAPQAGGGERDDDVTTVVLMVHRTGHRRKEG